MSDSPKENPKKAFGDAKPGLKYVPVLPLLSMGRVMTLGAKKYGPMNWRQDPIQADTYFDAMIRHLFSWWVGQEIDGESGESHLAHIMACCAILMDAKRHATLEDNREFPTPDRERG